MVEPDFRPLQVEENILRAYLKEQDYHSAYEFMEGYVSPFNNTASQLEQKVKELRRLLDKETLCTIISAEKTPVQLNLKLVKKHLAELDSYREETNKLPESDYNPGQISSAVRTYLVAISCQHAEQEKQLRRWSDMETLLERLARSSAADENYREARDYLKLSGELYQISVEYTSPRATDLPEKRAHLKNLQEAVAALTEHIQAEESIFPISRETYQAAAENMDCYASEKAYELRCAEVAPTANEIVRSKRERLEKLKEKISFLFQDGETVQK